MKKEVIRKVLWEDESQRELLIVEKEDYKLCSFFTLKKELYCKSVNGVENLCFESEIRLTVNEAENLAEQLLNITGNLSKRSTNNESVAKK